MRKALAFVLLTCGLAFVSARPLAAQEPSPEEVAAMMEEARKYRTPGDEHARLKQGEGEWLVETRTTMPGTPPLATWGSARARMTLGGRFLETEWDDPSLSAMMGEPMKGRVLIGYDKARKKWETISWSTMGTGTMISWGDAEKDGRIVFEGMVYEPPTPDGRPFRYVHRWIDADTQCVEAFDWVGGKFIRVVEQLLYRRRALFDGKSTAGWDRVPLKEGEDMSNTWMAVDGTLVCRGKPGGYIRTKESFKNYDLEIEWRWAPGSKGGNSGLLIHTTKPNELYGWPKCLEVQLQSGSAGDFWEIGESITVDDQEKRKRGRNIKRVAAKNPEMPVGAWNRMKVQCRGKTVKVWVNGVLVNEGRNCSIDAGKICLQSEGAPIHFRRVSIVSLPDAK